MVALLEPCWAVKLAVAVNLDCGPGHGGSGLGAPNGSACGCGPQWKESGGFPGYESADKGPGTRMQCSERIGNV